MKKLERFKNMLFLTPAVIIALGSVVGFCSNEILAAQSPNVDVVSGATYSSRGIIEAVTDALIKAGDTQLETEDNTIKNATNLKTTRKKNSKAIKSSKKKEADGKPADGVFSGEAVCENFGYTVHLKAKFRQGRTTAVFGLNITGNEDPANEVYWKKAWKPVVKRILQKQTGEVDAVSGATYSSRAVMEAYERAYEKAVVKNRKTKSRTKSTKKPIETKTPKTMLADQKTPSAASPEQGQIKDGTYHVSAACEPDEKRQFSSYTLSSNGILTGVKDALEKAKDQDN